MLSKEFTFFSYVIDRSKVRRERQKIRSELQQSCSLVEPLGIYVDGRKDRTLVNIKKDTSFHLTSATEEHVVLLSEPGSSYLGHVTPISGTSENITRSITTFIEEHKIMLPKLIGIGCDGTNVNTGNKNGIIKRLEMYVGHKLHWFVCLLHTNELPLRHLFLKVDGSKTTGPNQFSGPIGKALV